MSEAKIADIKKLKEIGLIKIESNELIREEKELIFYLGIDPTGKGIHPGHLIVLYLAKHLLKLGHKLIILIGGFTAKIGDPSDKKKERDRISEDTIEENSNGILSDIKKFFKDIEGITWVNNKDILSKVSLEEYLEYSRRFSLNRLLEKAFVKQRLDNNINLSYSEINYTILQAIDFLKLNKLYGCNVQIGGEDQWGNISTGIDFLKNYNIKAYGLCSVLLEQNGIKISKTQMNIRDSNDIWDFCINLQDETAILLYRIINIDLPEISIKEVKEYIAKSIIITFYSLEEFNKVRDINYKLHYNIGDIDASIKGIYKSNNLIDLLVEFNIATNKTQAKDFIKNNIININGKTVDKKYELEDNIELKIGKRIYKITKNKP